MIYSAPRIEIKSAISLISTKGNDSLIFHPSIPTLRATANTKRPARPPFLTIDDELVKTTNEELGLGGALVVVEVAAGVVETLTTTVLEGTADDDTAGALELLEGPKQVKSG